MYDPYITWHYVGNNSINKITQAWIIFILFYFVLCICLDRTGNRCELRQKTVIGLAHQTTKQNNTQ